MNVFKQKSMREQVGEDRDDARPDDRHQRLLDAVDAIPISFAIWDKNLNFVECNSQFLDLHADIKHLLKPGTNFEEVVRARAFSGRQPKAVGREEAWIKDRLEAMKTNASDYEFSIKGEWYRVVQKKLANGDIINYQKNITTEKLREIELAESEYLYRTLFEFCPDAVFIHDTETMLFANPAFVKLLDYASVDDIVGKPAFMQNPPDYQDVVKARVKTVLESGESAGRNEQVYLRADGSRVEIEAQSTAIVYQDKQAVLVIARDISARKKNQRKLAESYENLELQVAERTRDLTQEIDERRFTEEALRESEARFRDIAESTMDWIWEMDAELRFTYMSDRACKIYGWEADVPIGRTRTELIDIGEWTIDRSALAEHEKMMNAHETFSDIGFAVETKDGQKLYVQIIGRPRFDKSGKFIGYRGTASNVTDQKKTEIALRESEKNARVFLNATDDAAVLVDSDAVILDVNDAAIKRYGLSSDKLIGEILFNVMQRIDKVSQEYLDISRDRFREIVRTGKSVSFINKIGARWYESFCHVIEGESGGNPRVAIFNKDVTQQKHIEHTLRKAKENADLANRSKSEFLANISHELRSPLTAILGFTETMKEELFGPIENPKYKDYIENIFNSGTHLHELINDILDVSAIEAGRLSIDEIELDISEVVGSATRMVKPRAEKNGLEIVSQIPNDLPNIIGDERRLKQVLVNLLANAVKFTPEENQIFIAAERLDDGLSLSVADTGIGMDEQGIQQAMSKFGQVESGLARRYEGSGLGIPLSIGLVEMHGGHLEISSEVGVGTTVTITLPENRILTG